MSACNIARTKKGKASVENKTGHNCRSRTNTCSYSFPRSMPRPQKAFLMSRPASPTHNAYILYKDSIMNRTTLRREGGGLSLS